MRVRSSLASRSRVLAVVVCLLSIAITHVSTAQSTPTSAPHIAVHAPARLTQGDRAEILVEVVGVSVGAELPLVLTPTSEGTALEVVRGRLFRAEGERLENETLRFRVPVIAKEAGTAVFRAQVRTFACTQRCAPVTLAGTALMNVEPARTP